jgi:hypothetical protein
MLSKFRSHHKKILWLLALIIIPAFILWGGLSFLKEKKEDALGKIGNHTITKAEFHDYIKMANLYFIFFSDNKERASDKQIKIKIWELILLLWKANKEKITVDDREVIDAIKIKFSIKGKFNEAAYSEFLENVRRHMGLEPRVFEEYIRNIIKTYKIYDKYLKVTVNDGDAIKLYKKDNQKAKISYIFIPYDKFKNEITTNPQEAENFYNKNKSLFKEERKVKIKYAIVSKEMESVNKMLEAASRAKSIDNLKNKFSLEVKETGFISLRDPIEGIGWQPEINKLAFSLKKGKLNLLETNIGYIFIEKEEEKEAFIPLLNAIAIKVEERLREEKAKEKADILCRKTLETINKEGTKNFKKIAEREKLEYKETDYFKYYDYIEGLGLNEIISKIVFSLRKEQVYSYPILLLKGAYIIQLKEITSFNEKEFQDKKGVYLELIKQQKNLFERLKFLYRLEKETNLKIRWDLI